MERRTEGPRRWPAP